MLQIYFYKSTLFRANNKDVYVLKGICSIWFKDTYNDQEKIESLDVLDWALRTLM